MGSDEGTSCSFSAEVWFTPLLPNEIQGEEGIGHKAVSLDFQCSQTGMGNYVDSNGNRVNAGNFDANGFNVNYDSDDDCDPDLALGGLWQFLLVAATTLSQRTGRGGVFCFLVPTSSIPRASDRSH